MSTKLYKIGRILFLIYIVCTMFMLGVTAMLDVLPGKYICILVALVAVLTIICGLLVMQRRNGRKTAIAGSVICVILSIVYIVAGVYMYMTGSFLSSISDNGTDIVEYYAIVPVSEEEDDLDAIDGDTVYISSDIDSEYIEAQGILEEKAKESEVNFSFDYVEDSNELYEDVADEKKDASFMSKTAFDMYANDNSSFTEQVKVAYTVLVHRKSNTASKAVDVTKEPFNVYITGLDTTGTIDVTSLSDVNMIVSVNPVTRKILLTSIPRDYYVTLHDEKQLDKLTHTGSKGAAATVATVEDLMSCDINYYFKCNFSTVVNLIDAIGGVTVNSEYSFSTHGRQNEGFYFNEGLNNLTGDSALAFARERKSFSGGDRQRIKNQQLVLEATLNKVMTSSTLLKSYSSILSGLKDYIETNMTDREIKDLVKLQLEDMSGWSIEKISLDGTGDSQPCYLAGNGYASVIIPDEESISKAKEEMAKLFAGK